MNKKLKPRIVPESFNYVSCIHGKEPATLEDITPQLNRLSYVEPDIYHVPLSWQLQLDGTYRKIGICPICGQLYYTEEIRESLTRREKYDVR